MGSLLNLHILMVLLIKSLGAQNPGSCPSHERVPGPNVALCRKPPAHLLNLSSVVLLNPPKGLSPAENLQTLSLDFQTLSPSAPVLGSTKPISPWQTLSKLAPKNLAMEELVHQQTQGLFCCGFPKDLHSQVVLCVLRTCCSKWELAVADEPFHVFLGKDRGSALRYSP